MYFKRVQILQFLAQRLQQKKLHNIRRIARVQTRRKIEARRRTVFGPQLPQVIPPLKSTWRDFI